MAGSKMRCGVVGLFTFLLLAAGAPDFAFGADPIGRISVSGRLGVSGYQMDALNDGISRSNQRLAGLRPEWKVPERIHLGFDFLGDAAFDLTHSWRLGLVYQSTSGSTSVDYLQAITISPRSTMLIPRVFYRIPYRALIDMSLRAYAGPVFLSGVESTIEHENTSEGEPRLESMTIKASGRGLIGGIMAELTLADRFTLSFEGGYRRAKAEFDSGTYQIEKLRDPLGNPDGDALPNNRDLSEHSYLWGFLTPEYRPRFLEEPQVRSDLDLDFSGLVAQIGLRVYFL